MIINEQINREDYLMNLIKLILFGRLILINLINLIWSQKVKENRIKRQTDRHSDL